MPAIITVPYQELHAGLNESVDMKGVYAVKKYLVKWSDRWQFMRDVAGKTVVVGPPSAPTVIRSVPLQYPDNKNMYANGISVEPLGASHCTTPGSYDKAEITVNFGTPEFDYETSQGSSTQNTIYRSITVNVGAQIITLPEQAVRYATGAAVKPTQALPFVIPSAEITITSHQVPYLNFDLIFPFVGTLNQDPFYGCAIGTLMFMGVQASRQSTSEGLQAWQIEYKFNFRTIDWNKFLSPKKGVVFDYLYYDDGLGGTTTVYAYSDFTFIP